MQKPPYLNCLFIFKFSHCAIFTFAFLFSQKLALVGHGYKKLAAAVFEHALAAEAAGEAWVYRTVNKILLAVGQFRKIILAFFHVYVAGAAGAYAAAVVVKLNIVAQRYFQNRIAGGNIGQCNWLKSLLFKLKMNIVHVVLRGIWPGCQWPVDG